MCFEAREKRRAFRLARAVERHSALHVRRVVGAALKSEHESPRNPGSVSQLS